MLGWESMSGWESSPREDKGLRTPWDTPVSPKWAAARKTHDEPKQVHSNPTRPRPEH